MSRAVAFTDLEAAFGEVADEVRGRFDSILVSQRFVDGEQTEELERRLGALTGVHAVACSSGSDAIYLSLLAAGVGAGDAVIVPAFSFFSTAGSVVRTGAMPVFADVDPATLMMGSRELSNALDERFDAAGDGRRPVERRTGARLAAVVAVHLYGRAAPTDELEALLAEIGAPALVEDAAQAIGARVGAHAVGDGRSVCFSFYPTKNVGAAGDGGAITTRDVELAQRLRRLRNHGAGAQPYVHGECGINARIGELSAAMVNAKLDRLEAWTESRGRIAARYQDGLADLERRGRLRRPPFAAPPASVWHQYTLRLAGRRDAVAEALAAEDIDTRVFYPVPLHRQPCFASPSTSAHALPEAERAASDVLSLPIHPHLTTAQVDRVIDAMATAVNADLDGGPTAP